ncbi:nucleoside 2-deoxyribosyltransferase [Pontibacter korlensis]|uniref:Carbohydrate kinase PfkB domain-containing protein n=1 Tax=Pontibacter korlensis TaxID=400092 RepID=A0A0E3UXL4_9BACT|nr:nucleoside 2-deoxyribosyltransferase [Pontibacter korlensis]AKD04367.1 hypothetical protein PKOR_16330 [Pontibacter korlensis]
MDANAKICLIGDIVTDVTLKGASSEEYKVRLGGIVHAARGLWAIGVPYTVAYFAPDYLDKEIHNYLSRHGCSAVYKIGSVTGAPYVFLIEEVKEAGHQGYQFLLRDQIKVHFDETTWNENIVGGDFTDYIFVSGNYDIAAAISWLSEEAKIHIDLANNVEDLHMFEIMNRRLSTIFLSTSSTLFQTNFVESFRSFAKPFERYAKQLILKENRGGSRGIDFLSDEVVSVPAQTQPIMHSVGVGDVYNSTFVFQHSSGTLKEAMTYASWIATEYALTTFPDDFAKSALRTLATKAEDLISLGGVSLPWEARKSINIYIAAPDFDFVNVEPIDKLFHSLRYHNFNPRRPVQENGQMEKNALTTRKQELYCKDMVLLDECLILVAVLLYNDPGTLIEIGLAAAQGKPTIVYDPYQIAENCMLTQLPTLVSSDLDEVISEVFIQSSKLKTNEQ